MRKGETEEFTAILSALGLPDRVHVRNESVRFLSALKGVDDPEKKRQIIGGLFVDVQREAMQEYGIKEDTWLLGQGTIYPDTIESGGKSGKAALIKTHHNRCDEIRRLIEKGRVIEPLSEFYKDEVRHLGEALGLDRHLTQRWPFPGPGLAIRCLCNKEEFAARSLDLPKRRREYQAVTVPLRTVGVQGDARTHREAVAIRGPFDYEKLQDISTRICNTDKLHNRVIYEIASRTSTFDNARTKKDAFIDETRLSVLREADSIAREIMEERGLMEAVWQFPVVLIPLSLIDGESIVLRPVNSQDGMTANFARLQEPVLREIANRILANLPGIDAVFLDATDKPPATIEWE
jgi:GMP synthase (glutamine-hydrolysing)